MPRAPVLRNTCHGPRTSIPQRAGCLPPHTDRVQQDIHPPDIPAPSAQKSENAMWSTTSRPTTRKKPARAQLCHRRCSGQLRQPAPRRRPSTTGGQPRTEFAKWNNFLLLDANCQRLAVSHRKIGCGSTSKITRVEVAPMHLSLEPSLPVLVVPGMQDVRTNEVLHVLICLKTRARFENLIS